VAQQKLEKNYDFSDRITGGTGLNFNPVILSKTKAVPFAGLQFSACLKTWRSPLQVQAVQKKQSLPWRPLRRRPGIFSISAISLCIFRGGRALLKTANFLIMVSGLPELTG